MKYLDGLYTLTKFFWDEDPKALTILTEKNDAGLTPRDLIIEFLPSGTTQLVSYDYTELTIGNK